MGFQFNMEVLNDFPIVHLSSHDQSIVHKVFNRNENAIDEERMPGRKVHITMGISIVQSKASYPDRSYALMPGGRGNLLKPATSDPFDRERTVEGFDESADCQFFNRNLTARS